MNGSLRLVIPSLALATSHEPLLVYPPRAPLDTHTNTTHPPTSNQLCSIQLSYIALLTLPHPTLQLASHWSATRRNTIHTAHTRYHAARTTRARHFATHTDRRTCYRPNRSTTQSTRQQLHSLDSLLLRSSFRSPQADICIRHRKTSTVTPVAGDVQTIPCLCPVSLSFSLSPTLHLLYPSSPFHPR